MDISWLAERLLAYFLLRWCRNQPKWTVK